MIILRLRGALGNQLFSYAFAKSIALKKQDTLIIDKAPIYHYFSQSYYNLDKYQIKSFVAPFDTSRIVSTLIKRKVVDFKILNTVTSSELYNPEYLETALESKNIVLDGHWQSYKYFQDQWNVIKKEFVLKEKYIQKNQLENEISQSNSVSLHVRRGDYTNATSGFNVLDTSYYENALQIIRERYIDFIVYVFSDDIDWCKENFRGSLYRFVKPNITYPYNDLRLMSLCKHNIICNSTFSWWAGYMNTNQEKIVVAPNNWFSEPSKNNHLEYLIPQTWKRI